MKHKNHSDRKSFAKHGMANQQTQTITSSKLDERRAASMFSGRNHENVGKNGLKLRQAPARTLLTPDFRPKTRLVAREMTRSQYGPKVHSKGRIYSGKSVEGSHRDWQQKMEAA